MLFQNRLDDMLGFATELWPGRTAEGRRVSAWKQMLSACRRFEAGLTDEEAEKFKGLTWYPVGWNLHLALSSIGLALLTMMQVTASGSKDRRRDLDAAGELFRSVMESDSLHQFRQWVPVPYRSALFVILCHLENAFENMLHVAETAEMDDPALVRTIGVDVHAAMSMLLKLIEYEPVAEDGPPDQTGLRFEEDRTVRWNGTPIHLHPQERKVLLVLWERRKEAYVPYADLERVRDMPVHGEVVLRTAGALRSVIHRINRGLRAVACPHRVKRPKGCPGYRLILHEDTIGQNMDL
jgi:hypothetical protein